MNNHNEHHQYLESVITIAKTAGAAIMQVYATDFNVVNKEDNSPLTHADLAAHHVIVSALNKLTPHIPTLSEESEIIDYETRKHWSQYWLIDPLDGTREFIKRNGEFTVNIALISGNNPILGVVYAPVIATLYYASFHQGSYKQLNDAPAVAIHARTLDLKKSTVIGSRSHVDKKMQAFMENFKVSIAENTANSTPELIRMGSSLKICLLAEGLADVYPRLGPTFEWDTAAAHCILTEAGGDIIDKAGNSLQYNWKPSLLNPWFFAKGANHHLWTQYLE